MKKPLTKRQFKKKKKREEVAKKRVLRRRELSRETRRIHRETELLEWESREKLTPYRKPPETNEVD